MKFVSRPLAETADASAGEGSQGRELLKLSVWALLVLVGIYFVVGLVTDFVVSNISVETERKLFSGISGVMGESALDADAQRERLARVLATLKTSPEVPDLPYRLLLIAGDAPNAFAYPGGTIGVSRGLLDVLSDEEDDIALAFVLAHELGHFKNRDHLRGLGRSVGVAICYALIFGGSGDLLTSNSLNLMSKRYSRNQEEAADRFGVRLLAQQYGKTEGMTRFFEALSASGKGGPRFVAFSSHPHPADRIEKMKAYAKELQAKGADAP